MTTPLLILILSHLITDFVLQRDWLVRWKHDNNPKIKHLATLAHSFVFLLLSLPLSWILVKELSGYYILGLVFITITHYGIDLGKINLQRKYPSKASAYYLFMHDQIFHFLIITTFLVILYPDGLRGFLFLFMNIYGEYGLASYFNPLQKFGIVLSALIFLTSFANIFIRIALLSIKPSLQETTEGPNNKVGRYIGGVERILTVMAVVAGEYQALVALYAAKTAMRFGEARENQEFAEYFLLGTSVSVLIAIVIGLLLKSTLGIYN